MLLWALFQPFLNFWTWVFVSALSNFNKNLWFSLSRIVHCPYLMTVDILSGFLSSTIPQVMSDLSGLPSARILLGQFSQKFPDPRCFLSVVFHPLTTPYYLVINSHFFLYSELNSLSFLHWKTWFQRFSGHYTCNKSIFFFLIKHFSFFLN